MTQVQTPIARLEDLRASISAAGGEFLSIQETIPPAPYQVAFAYGKAILGFDLGRDELEEKDFSEVVYLRALARIKLATVRNGEKKMTLREKLWKIYTAVEAIEKAGHNKSQNYDYIRAVDVTKEIRKQLIALRVYAQINFDFDGPTFTVARDKAPNAPFTAERVKCSIVFHDLDTDEKISTSGLGTGCDTNDKAAYKAQTGALKYALKNAALVPDENDPERTEYASGEMPDFDDVRSGVTQSKPVKQSKPEAKPEPQFEPEPLPPVPAASIPTSFPVEGNEPINAAPAPSAAQQQALSEGNRPPTEDEMKNYRDLFRKLGDDLSDPNGGHLQASRSLPITRKLLVFLLKTENQTDPNKLTFGQWRDFFFRVDKYKASEAGLVGLGQLVDKANGIEPKEKK